MCISDCVCFEVGASTVLRIMNRIEAATLSTFSPGLTRFCPDPNGLINDLFSVDEVFMRLGSGLGVLILSASLSVALQGYSCDLANGHRQHRCLGQTAISRGEALQKSPSCSGKEVTDRVDVVFQEDDVVRQRTSTVRKTLSS